MCGQNPPQTVAPRTNTRKALRALGRTPYDVAINLEASGVRESTKSFYYFYTPTQCIVALYLRRVTGVEHSNDGVVVRNKKTDKTFRLPNAVRDFVRLRDSGWIKMERLEAK